MKPRVLHAVESLSTGILQVIRILCAELSNDIEFCVLHGVREETPKNLQELFPANTRLVRWDVGRSISPKRDRKALGELRGLVRDWEPNLVHAHSSKAGALARVAALFDKTPLVYTPHGYSFLRLDISRPARMFYKSAEWLLGRVPHLTVACGAGEYIDARAVATRAAFVRNMIEPLRPVPAIAGQREWVAAMCGSIRPQKNFPLFVELARRLQDMPIMFEWIGGGTIPVSGALPPNIRVTGWLPRDEAVARLARAQVFVQTSLWEGLPIAVLEAMSLGIPVLATPCSGNRELVVDGVNGYICKDADVFEHWLRLLMASPEHVKQMGMSGRELAGKNHSVGTNVLLWRSIYEHYERYREIGNV